MKFDNDCDVIYVQNVIEDRLLWNKCSVIYQTKVADDGAARCSTSEVVKLKIRILQDPCVLLSYNVTTCTTRNSCCKTEYFCRAAKYVDFPGVLTCCLRHVHLSLRQATTYLTMTSKSCSLSYFEHSSC